MEHEKEQEPGLASARGSFGFVPTGPGLITPTASGASIETHQVLLYNQFRLTTVELNKLKHSKSDIPW